MSKSKPSPFRLFAALNACPKHQSGTDAPQLHLGFSQFSEAAANCTVGRHRWVSTTAVGLFQCAMCGTTGYCFTCCPYAPQDAVSAPCPSHRAQGKGRQV